MWNNYIKKKRIQNVKINAQASLKLKLRVPFKDVVIVISVRLQEFGSHCKIEVLPFTL